MRSLLWLLCSVSVLGVFFVRPLNEALSGTRLNGLVDTTIVQVVLAALAGIFATKASDSSRELRALLKVSTIEDLLGQAQKAKSLAHEQKTKLIKLNTLIKSETQAEFAREMIRRHRVQLDYHWSEILKLETLLGDGIESSEETELRNRVRAYLIKSRYIDYMGRGFLRSIPIIGSLLHMLFGPFWDEWYYRNLHKINRRFRATADATPSDDSGPTDADEQ